MKRLKIALMATAISLSLGGAVTVAQTTSGCELAPQYYLVANTYQPAGMYGYNYFCLQSSTICTWYRPNPVSQPNYYAPCRIGFYCLIR